jgi:tetratricopeptide (TPR) repeat protein
VKVGPAGASSVASEVGSDLSCASNAGGKQKVGKESRKYGALPCGIPAEFDGVSLRSVLATGKARSRVLGEVDVGAEWFTPPGVVPAPTPLPAFTGVYVGDLEIERRQVALAGSPVAAAVERPGAGLSYGHAVPGLVAFDVLQHFDLGIDPSRGAVALRANSGTSAPSYGPVWVARLLGDSATATGAEASPTGARASLATGLAALAGAQEATRQYAEAAKTAQRWTEAAPQDCSAWQALGKAELASGDPSGAVAPLRKAAELYAAWAVRPLAERRKLEAIEERATQRGLSPVPSQASACHTAWGELASALLGSGDGAGAVALFPAHVDLDAGLPRAVGNALLLTGKLEAAEAAYRQALKLSYANDATARAGMLFVTRGRSLELALAQFSEDPASPLANLRFYGLHAELLRQAKGTDGAMAALEAFLARAPGSVPGWLVLASAQQSSGRDASGALGKASAVLDETLPWTPGNASSHAWKAELLRLRGELDTAATTADQAMALDPASAEALFVRARVAESQGDAGRAAELRKLAGQVAASDPQYASLLAGGPG